ncbi:MAG: hypothetical protein HYY16_00215 [Planctomycetes bacterium]|nr:hypothetical protein [Planctomycetota bacterium]
MRRAALLLSALAGCVTVTTRATIHVGAGGTGDVRLRVERAGMLRVVNIGSVPVEIVDERTFTPLAPGATVTLDAVGEKRLRVVNRTQSEASVRLEAEGMTFLRPP